MAKETNVVRKKWTKERLLNLLATSNNDLFSVKGYEPTAKDLRLWLDRYLKRETFKARQKRKQNGKQA